MTLPDKKQTPTPVLAVFIVLIISLLSGCGRQEDMPTRQEAPSPAAESPAPAITTPTPASTEEGTSPAKSDTTSTASSLAGTRWRLVEFQSMDDATGVLKPDDPALYTMQLNADGTVNMAVNCNRATGSWKATPGADGVSGQFEFGPLAATRALCAPPSMDELVTGQAEFVRSFLIQDGKLYLSLWADGGVFVWEPDERQ